MPDIDSILETYGPVLVGYAAKILGVLLALWIALRIASSVQTRITNGLRKKDFDETLAIFFGSISRWLIIVGAVLGCLGAFGIETTSFAAIIGAAGLAVGLAFQGTLSNFAAGVMLLVFRPFKVGDVITAAGQTGKVTEIGLFVCSMDTVDNRRIIVPNSSISTGTIENITHHPTRRVDLTVGVDYGADLDKTRQALDGAATGVAGRLEDPGHDIVLVNLGDSSVDWSVRIWCKTEDYWAVREAAVTAIKNALDTAKIDIPYPHMDVNLTGATGVRL